MRNIFLFKFMMLSIKNFDLPLQRQAIKKKIIYGSTQLLNPNTFLQELAKLG
jgi:hypothetical protein